MAKLKLFTFGPPRLESNGQPTKLNLRKALALLVYLAVSGQPHSRDALATMLWPEHDQRAGRSRLRRTLHRLHAALGERILDRTPDTIRLQPAADLWIDCAVFRHHVAAGLPSAPAEVLAPERLAHLTAAVDLYADDFLAGFTLPDSPSFDEWQFFQQEGLRQLYGQVLEQLIQAYRTRQAWDAAIGYARRWVALDRLHEPAHRTLMRLYAWSGQHAAVLRQYQECVRILDAELGSAPEDETIALYEAIRTRQFRTEEPAPTAAEPTAAYGATQTEHVDAAAVTMSGQPDDAYRPLPPSPADEPAFVARQRERHWLGDLLDAALEGGRSVGFVVGEAGQGKTALLRSFARSAHKSHPALVVAWGSCNAYTGAGDPYFPFREALEMLTGNVDGTTLTGQLPQANSARLWNMLPRAAQVLIEAGPDLLDTFIPARGLLRRAAAYAGGDTAWMHQLQEFVAHRHAHPSDPRQQDLFEQYARVVHELARQSTLLLVLDDLQWVDRGSADLLLHLGRRLKGCRVLIVGAYRPAEVAIGRSGERHPLARVINEFQRDFGDIILDLAQAEGQALVEGLIDSEPNRLDRSFRDTLYRKTGGHPLFTVELLRGMQERGDLVKDAAGRWIEQGQLDWKTVPARVEGAISERFGRLAPPLQELLQVASVEGEEFTAELVARALGVDEREVVRSLSRDLDKTHRLVQFVGIRREGTLRLSRYRFRHILIQQYIYNRLDEAEQVYFNEALGHELERMYGDQTEPVAAQLARHYQEAGISERAVTYLLQAGQRASRLSAHEEAIAYVQRGLALLAKLPHTPERDGQERELQIALGPALIAARGYAVPEVEETYARARELIPADEQSPQLFRVLFGLWGFHLVRAELQTTRELAEQALRLAERIEDSALILEAHRALGIAWFQLGKFAQARVHLEQGSRLYNPQQHAALAVLSVADPGATCIAYLARTLWHLGFPDQALDKGYEALDLARRLAHPFTLAAVHVYAARVHQYRREAQATREHAEAAIGLSTEHGFPHYIAMGSILAGWALARQGHEAEGIERMRHGLTAGRSTQMAITQTHHLAMLAEAYGAAGQIEQGLEALAEALASVERSQEGQWQAELYRLRGELLLLKQGQQQAPSQGNRRAEAEATPEGCFRKAIDLARRQGSRSLELRATISLCRLWQRRGVSGEARPLLADIYGQFAEGFATADLQEARTLLVAL